MIWGLGNFPYAKTIKRHHLLSCQFAQALNQEIDNSKDLFANQEYLHLLFAKVLPITVVGSYHTWRLYIIVSIIWSVKNVFLRKYKFWGRFVSLCLIIVYNMWTSIYFPFWIWQIYELFPFDYLIRIDKQQSLFSTNLTFFRQLPSSQGWKHEMKNTYIFTRYDLPLNLLHHFFAYRLLHSPFQNFPSSRVSI